MKANRTVQPLRDGCQLRWNWHADESYRCEGTPAEGAGLSTHLRLGFEAVTRTTRVFHTG